MKGNRKIQKRKIKGFQEIQRLRKKTGDFYKNKPYAGNSPSSLPQRWSLPAAAE